MELEIFHPKEYSQFYSLAYNWCIMSHDGCLSSWQEGGRDIMREVWALIPVFLSNSFSISHSPMLPYYWLQFVCLHFGILKKKNLGYVSFFKKNFSFFFVYKINLGNISLFLFCFLFLKFCKRNFEINLFYFHFFL